MKNPKPSPLREYGALTAVLAEAGLKFVDVGGRREAFHGVAALAEFSHYYVSEPDAAEAARLADALPKETRWRGVTVFAEAIASQAGPVTLYVTRNPGMSSLLEPDGRVAGPYWIADKFEVIGHASVPAIGLDDASRRYGFTDASFLKLDTQGSELDILLSGTELVRDSLVGVHTEVWFQAFYRGQPLFADIDSHLRARGFSLVTMNRTLLRRARIDEPFYSRRTITWAHCLYLREPDDLQQGGPQLARLLALAIAFDYFDLALDIVGRLSRTETVSDAFTTRLAADVRQLAANVTNRLRRMPARDLGPDGLTARSFKDRRR